MKKLLFAIGLALAVSVILPGCKTPTLEPGGLYNPTNAIGQVLYNNTGFALADTTYRLTYETALAVFAYERNNRKVIWDLSPQVKKSLDRIRPTVVDIDHRWAMARKAYRANPTPAGLSTLQSILDEIQKLLPIIQQQLAPVYSTLTLKP